MKSDWRDNEIAGKFLTGIRAALPLAATQLDLMARITREFCAEVKTFLDLGCGDGIIGRYIHDHYPEATGIYVDYSETMIAELRKKVKYNSQILTEDYSQDQWMTLVEKKKPFDLVVSGYSIHHLSHESKGILYQRIYGLLKPGGLFLNLDHVASPTPQIEKLFDDLFIDSLAEFQNGLGQRKLAEGISTARFNGFNARFDQRMVRHGERQARNDDIGKRFAGNVHALPETVRAKEH